MTAAFVLWVAFFVGQMVHVLIRSSWAVRSKTSPVASHWQFLKIWGDVIIIRTLIEGALFWLYWAYPAVLTSIAEKFGLTWNLTLPLVPPVAFFIGLTADFLLDWVLARFPIFQKELPHLPVPNGNGAPVDEASKGQGAGQ